MFIFIINKFIILKLKSLFEKFKSYIILKNT